MYHHLGHDYAESWARDQHLAMLEDHTVLESLDAGEPPKLVWRAVADALRLDPEDR